MILGIPKEVVLAKVNAAFTRNLIILGIVASLALALAWFGGTALLMRRMNPLISAATDLSSGDMTARVRASTAYGKDELSRLAHIFDQMADSLELREKNLQSVNLELTRAHDAVLG